MIAFSHGTFATAEALSSAALRCDIAMTHEQLPAQAANIVHAVGSSTTCTPATVDCLRTYLIPAEASSLQQKPTPTNLGRANAKVLRARAINGPSSKHGRRPGVTISEVSHEGKSVSQPREKAKLATEVVNATLKALTEAVKNLTLRKTDRRKPLVKSISSATTVKVLAEGAPEPLHPICVNIVSSVAEARSPRRSLSNVSSTYFHGLKSQAECARIAFLALRSMSTRKVGGIDLPYLQLESGMSALIGKMIALGFDDLAAKELQILKRRLDHSTDNISTNEESEPNTLPRPAGKKPTKLVALADLLQFQNTDASGPLLALIIASQIQVLKIMISKSDAREIEAGLKYIQLGAPTSPANFIQRQLDASPASRTQVARQLDMLAQTIISLSSCKVTSPDEQNPGPKGKVSSHTTFEMQTLVLKIRSRSWKLSDLQNDPLKELVYPFARYLSSFYKLSPLAPKEKYELAKTAFESLFACTEDETTANFFSVDSRKHPILTVYQGLADLAQGCCNYEEAVQWLQRSLKVLGDSDSSCTALCATVCRIANLQLRAFGKDTKPEGLLLSLKEAVNCLEGDIRGDSVDLDDLLQVVISLRRLAFPILQNYQKLPDQNRPPGFSDILDHCSQLIILGAKFLIRYVGRGSGPGKDGKALIRHDQRKRMIWNNARPFFQSIAAMVRFSMATSMEDWTRLESGLQECVRLASVLVETEFVVSPESNNRDFQELSLVPLSNAYWYRYQYLKQRAGPYQDIRRNLRFSIEILQNRPCTEKLAGLLPSKLEKYGAIYEASKNYVKAASIYAEALRLQIDGGLLGLAAEAATSRPLIDILGEKGSQNILGRLLLAYSRAILGMDSRAPEANLVFDDENILPSERGLLLEQQLAYVASAPHISQSSFLSGVVQSLAESLLAIYTDSEFPIRRLRVGLQLLRVHFTHPATVKPKIVEQILCSQFSSMNSNHLNRDAGLKNYAAHLLNCRVLYVNLGHAEFEMKAVEGSLTSWSSMLQKCSDLISLQSQVGDVSDWILLLESFAQYLEMQNIGLLRVSVLHLLASILEKGVHVEPSAMVSVYSVLGLQYVRLGYSNQAGHALHKASKYLLSPEISGPVLVKWNLASAEYALGLGNVVKA